MRLVRAQLAKHRRWFAGAIVFQLVSVTATLYLPTIKWGHVPLSTDCVTQKDVLHGSEAGSQRRQLPFLSQLSRARGAR
jgi:hypothetical protein